MKLDRTFGSTRAQCSASIPLRLQNMWNTRRLVPYELLVFGAKVSSRTCWILARSDSSRFVGCPLSSRLCRACFGLQSRMQSPAVQLGLNSDALRWGEWDLFLEGRGVSVEEGSY